MLYYTVLYYIILYCIILYYTNYMSEQILAHAHATVADGHV